MEISDSKLSIRIKQEPAWSDECSSDGEGAAVTTIVKEEESSNEEWPRSRYVSRDRSRDPDENFGDQDVAHPDECHASSSSADIDGSVYASDMLDSGDDLESNGTLMVEGVDADEQGVWSIKICGLCRKPFFQGQLGEERQMAPLCDGCTISEKQCDEGIHGPHDGDGWIPTVDDISRKAAGKRTGNLSHNLKRSQIFARNAASGKYKCHFCDKRFTQNCNLKRHLRCHTGEKPFRCTVCHRDFAEHASLKDHMTLHTGEKRHKCHACNKRFAQRSTLSRHITHIHMDEHLYKCRVCKKYFVVASSLEEHMKTHHKK